MNAMYYKLLREGKMEEAERIRILGNPKTLYKFVPLDGTEEDNKRFYSLSENSMWFSSVESFNDPYEHKGMILNREELIEAGIPKVVIEEYEELFVTDDLEVASLSASEYSNLPMWAYYTNNSKGFCIEYEVINGSAVHEVIYEPKRIKVGKLIIEMMNNAIAAMKGDIQAKIYSDSLARILMSSMYIKDSSWEHEKEYRIVAPIRKSAGENIPISNVGLRVKRIIAGIHCEDSSKKKLYSISKKIGCTQFFCAMLSNDSYGIELKEYH